MVIHKVTYDFCFLSHVVGIGINWDTDRPSAEYVMDLLDCLGKRLEVKDVSDIYFYTMTPCI